MNDLAEKFPDRLASVKPLSLTPNLSHHELKNVAEESENVDGFQRKSLLTVPGALQKQGSSEGDFLIQNFIEILLIKF